MKERLTTSKRHRHFKEIARQRGRGRKRKRESGRWNE